MSPRTCAKANRRCWHETAAHLLLLASVSLLSISIPASELLADPVEIDGRLLVDGGIADNLPIGVARAFEPDLIIAVDVSDTMRPLSEKSSAHDIVNQMLTALMRRETTREGPT